MRLIFRKENNFRSFFPHQFSSQIGSSVQ